MPKARVMVRPLELEDVPVAAQISADAFMSDRHTQMKALGKEPFDMRQYALTSLPRSLRNSQCVLLKAFDSESESIMGYCNWGFHGFTPNEIAAIARRESWQEDLPPDPTPSSPGPAGESDDTELDPIKRLEALTDADMQAWMREVMPEGARCLYLNSLSVTPRYQRCGAGSAMLEWGTALCDQAGVFAWVHASEPSWEMYAKRGFEVIKSLTINLDDYAPMSPPDEQNSATWGSYTFRYMKYFPLRKNYKEPMLQNQYTN